MGNPNTFKKFIGKVISFWCGEYDPENNELLVVLEVEAVEDGWLIGITPESKRKYWFDIFWQSDDRKTGTMHTVGHR